MDKDVLRYFNENAAALAAQYNAIDRACMHEDLLSLLPKGKTLRVLDVGAGSGIDAALFAQAGHAVIAVEPAADLRALGEKSFGDLGIIWSGDTLPDLAQVSGPFDVIYAVGTFQYLDTQERARAFARLVGLLAEGGFLEIQFPTPPSREYQHKVPADEIRVLAGCFNGVSLGIVAGRTIRDPSGRKALDGTDLFFNITIVQKGKNVYKSPTTYASL